MKKFLLVTLLAGLSTIALGEQRSEEGKLVEVALLGEVDRQESFREEHREIALIEDKKAVALTTTSFTGIEYERFNSQKSDNAYDVSYILLDGYTKVTDNWGVVHVVKRRQTYLDGDRVEDANIFEVYPRYDRDINDNWAFGFEFGVESIVSDKDGGDEDYFKYRPDVTYTTGNHLLNVPFLGVNVSQTGKDFYEFEPTYMYTLSDFITLGLQGFRRDGNDNFVENQIRPFVHFNFENTAFLEVKMEIGTYEDEGSSANNKGDVLKTIAYGEYPLTESLRAVGEVSFNAISQDRSENEAGDTDVYFVKTGINWTL